MMKALIVGGLALLSVLAVAPATEAAPLPCNVHTNDDPFRAAVVCRVDGLVCVGIAVGGYYYCTP